MRRMIAGVLALALTACGGEDGSAGGAGPGTGTSPTPTPIAITSATSANAAENSAGTVYQVTTTGGSGTATYALGGADAATLAISATGAISFRSAPDFEQPADADRNNSYVVTVQVADASGQASREVTIFVTNVADATTVTPFGGTYANIAGIAIAPDSARVFVPQADGTVWIVDPTTAAKGAVYLTIGGTGQRQLLAVAAAPDYGATGTLYASVLTTTGIEVRRYGRAGPEAGNPASEDLVLRIPLPNATTQNVGGWIGFGPDNFLYVATGSAATDATVAPPPNSSLLGKVLRIDPGRDDFPADPARDYAIPASNPFAGSGGGGGAGEVYANGFRDPRTGNFDGTNVYVSDRYETFAGGSGYLYLIRPADAGRTFAPPGTTGTLPPVLSASNNLGSGGTIVAGAAYRGIAPDLVGRYVFGAQGGTGANNFAGVYTVGASSLVAGTTQALRGCCTLLNGAVPVAFAGDGNRDLYFATATGLFVVQYR